MRRILLGATALTALLAGSVAWAGSGNAAGIRHAASSAPAGEQSADVVLGTYNLAANDTGIAGLGLLGELLHNQVRLNLQPPCTDCDVTSITPDLTDTNGNSVNMDTGPMLHHVVIYQQGASDVSCPGPFSAAFLGKRLFASGNERTSIPEVPGYGLYIPSGAQFATIADLMNYSSQPQTVQIRMHMTWVPGNTLKPITPVWLDETGCGVSYFDVPAGQSHQSTTWTSNVSGTLIGLGGHLHEYGQHIDATDETTGANLCDSQESQMAMSDGTVMVTNMSKCIGTAPDYIAEIHKGDKIQMDSYYDPPNPEQGVMGIMIMYVYEH